MKKLFFLLIIFIITLSNKSQIISTYAGNGNSGVSGDYGPATNAEIGSPDEIAVFSLIATFTIPQCFINKKVKIYTEKALHNNGEKSFLAKDLKQNTVNKEKFRDLKLYI